MALVVSGLLAVYKILIVRRSGVRECAICVPIMMLIVFATYATGNNVVYYAKEGFTRPLARAEAQDRRGDRGRGRTPQSFDRHRSGARDRSPDRDRPIDRDRSADRERLKQELRKFDMEQRELDAKRQSIKPDPRPRAQEQRPLIKSW